MYDANVTRAAEALLRIMDLDDLETNQDALSEARFLVTYLAKHGEMSTTAKESLKMIRDLLPVLQQTTIKDRAVSTVEAVRRVLRLEAAQVVRDIVGRT